MTVKDLSEKLKDMDQEAEVVVWNSREEQAIAETITAHEFYLSPKGYIYDSPLHPDSKKIKAIVIDN